MSLFGRRVPSDWRHVERYPLTALPADERPVNVPSPVGINFYSAFDSPVLGSDGRWRVATSSQLGSIRGGHCLCVPPAKFRDPRSWWRFYDQGQEGACVGFGCSRCMSLLNRKKYDASWLYHTAQYRDEYADTPPAEGTSVRAGLQTMMDVGLKVVRGKKIWEPQLQEGIAAFRWVTDVNDWLRVLGRSGASEVPFLNSWGANYPHVVYMPTEVWARLLSEDGEFGVVTDR